MKYPGNDIRVAIYNALNGQPLYNGAAVPIWANFAPPGTGFPRIIITDPEGGQDGGKQDQNLFDLTMVIKISSAFTGDVADANQVGKIAEAICLALMPSNSGPFPVADNFGIWLINLLGDTTLEYESGRKKYIDKNLRLNIKIEQL